MKRRSCTICNLKTFLLFCVVLGHALERDITYHPTAAILYRVLYLFHMPLFAFVSGLGAKSGRACFRQTRQAGKWYLLAQGLALFVCLLVQPGSFSVYLTRPYWHLWYLLSLAAWHLLTCGGHLILTHTGTETGVRTKQRLLLLAVTVGLPAGYFPIFGRVFSLSRTLVFFPFFLAGALCGQIIIDWVSRTYWLLPLAFSVAVSGYFFTAKLPVSFFYQAEGYSAFGLAGLSGIKVRLVCYIVAAACAVLVLILCPKKKCTLTQVGGDTLMPYLLHPVFIKCLELIPYAPQYAVPVSFALALLAVFNIHLCFKWRRRLFLYMDTSRKRGKELYVRS